MVEASRLGHQFCMPPTVTQRPYTVTARSWEPNRVDCTDPRDPTADDSIAVDVHERGRSLNDNTSPHVLDAGEEVVSLPDAQVRAASSSMVISKGFHENTGIIHCADN